MNAKRNVRRAKPKKGRRVVRTGCGNAITNEPTFRATSRLPFATPRERLELCRETFEREPRFDGPTKTEMTPEQCKAWAKTTAGRAYKKYLDRGGVL